MNHAISSLSLLLFNCMVVQLGGNVQSCRFFLNNYKLEKLLNMQWVLSSRRSTNQIIPQAASPNPLDLNPSQGLRETRSIIIISGSRWSQWEVQLDNTFANWSFSLGPHFFILSRLFFILLIARDFSGFQDTWFCMEQGYISLHYPWHKQKMCSCQCCVPTKFNLPKAFSLASLP